MLANSMAMAWCCEWECLCEHCVKVLSNFMTYCEMNPLLIMTIAIVTCNLAPLHWTPTPATTTTHFKQKLQSWPRFTHPRFLLHAVAHPNWLFRLHMTVVILEEDTSLVVTSVVNPGASWLQSPLYHCVDYTVIQVYCSLTSHVVLHYCRPTSILALVVISTEIDICDCMIKLIW